MAKEDKFWLNFFINAGIPKKVSAEYAKTFVDNRMDSSLVPDLSELILQKLGVNKLGDILMITKHAKFVSSHESKPVLRLENIAGDQEKVKPKPKATLTNVEYLSETEEEEEEEVKIQKPAKRITVKQPKNQQQKGKKRSSGDVFNRLGDDANNDVIVISDNEPEGPPTLQQSQKRKKAKKSSDVFSRLAAPQLDTSDEDNVVDVRVEQAKRKKIKKPPVEINVTFKSTQKKPAAATAGRLRIRGIPKNKISKATEEVYTSLHSDNIGNNQVKKRIGLTTQQQSRQSASTRKETKSVGVFSRLGRNTTTVASQPKVSANKKVGGSLNMDRVEGSAFSRLGGATTLINTDKKKDFRKRLSSEGSELQYHGVLKSGNSFAASKKTTGVFARLGAK